MRVVMLASWNTTDGVSYHAELIGRELAKNHKLAVFAPTFESIGIGRDWHQLLIGKDEDFVIRGFEQTWGSPGWVNERLGREKCDIFVVEALDRMPIPTLIEMFPKIKAKKIQVIHEWSLPNIPKYYELNFDAIVCFDHRYKKMFLEKYPEEKIHVIPYPCRSYIRGNKEKAREKLGLPKDKLILFTFGRQPLKEYNDYLWLANELGKKYNLEYLVVRSDRSKEASRELRELSRFCEVRLERPSVNKIYDYLHASDIHLLPKGISSSVVVSSTVFQCLGSGTPIVIPDTRYVEELAKEVVKYQPNNKAHLKTQVLRLIKEGNFRKTTIDAAKKYVKENSVQKITEQFVNLFHFCESSFGQNEKIKELADYAAANKRRDRNRKVLQKIKVLN